MNYIGSKKSLKDWIFEIIKNTSKGNIFCDLFAGSCEITKEAKKQGYKVIANDLQTYSYILAETILKNLKFENFNIIPIKGIITELYAEQSKYFTIENAMWCDGVLNYIKNKEEKIPILASLINAMDKVANTASVYGAYLKHYKKAALKQPVLEQEDYPGIEGIAFNKKAEELITEITGDILYLDPPYNTRQYSSNYHVLETIARMDNPEVHGKTLLRDDCEKSVFSSKAKVAEALEYLIANANFKYIYLSYNNEGILSFDKIKEIFEKYGKYEVAKKEYKKFNPGSGVEIKNTIEYLHILYKE